VDSAAAIGVPSGLIACEGARMAGVLAGTSVNAGGADSMPEEARFGASAAAFPVAEAAPLSAEAGLASTRVSKAPACEGAAWLGSANERDSLEGLRACSLSDLTIPSVVSSCVHWSRVRATLAQTAAAPASASPPAVSFHRRDLGRVGFGSAVGSPVELAAIAVTGRSLFPSICDRRLSRPGELDLGAVDAERGGASGARADASSARFNSASMSSAFTRRFAVPSMGSKSLLPISLAPQEMSYSRPSHHTDG
jgi:hypothetical protein